MEGSCSTGQSPPWAVMPVEEGEEEEEKKKKIEINIKHENFVCKLQDVSMRDPWFGNYQDFFLLS
jgi:hypothetical protein